MKQFKKVFSLSLIVCCLANSLVAYAETLNLSSHRNIITGVDETKAKLYAVNSIENKSYLGWIQNNGYWYYLNNDGSMATGWLQDNGYWYYLNSDGSMAHDTYIDGYYLGSNGAWVY